MENCLYCKEKKESSMSHIIPETLCTNGPTLSNGVCKECNNFFSKVEQPVIGGLSIIRSALGIKDKRNRLPLVKIEAEFLGLKMPISVYDPSDIHNRHLVFPQKTSEGGETIYFFGPDKEVKELQNKYSKRNPNVKWGELPTEQIQHLYYRFELDYSVFGTKQALQVASKIAFEWLCKEKGDVNLLLGQEYDDIRNYIIGGIEAEYPVACVATHPNILQGLYNHIPFGIHYIVTCYNQKSPVVVAIVGLFGLVPYKIILTRRYPLRIQQLTLSVIHPQSGFVYEPKLRGQLSDPMLYGQAENDYYDPMKAVKILSSEITNKINNSGFVKQNNNPEE